MKADDPVLERLYVEVILLTAFKTDDKMFYRCEPS